MSTHVVGIDLGTSNCAVAYADLAGGGDAKVFDFPVPQLERLGEVASRPLLPSAVYIPREHEFPDGSIQLPWPSSSHLIVGEFARWQGARVPGRLVSSAKSWLCHPTVDRAAPILPWGAPPEVSRISPVHASALLLEHIAHAWNAAHPDWPLAAQEVIITVPASFDEVARALTVNAAKKAGLERFTLLEEPQAAFYDFTARHRRDLAKALEGVDLVLVVDVGGGTSDFTLVQAGLSPEGPILRRTAVGEHLILGGDNMDAALARRAEEQMLTGSRRLTAVQWSQLLQAARVAKEILLSADAPEQYRLAIAGEGSRLIGSTLSAHLERAQAEQAILDGFFPYCERNAVPARSARVALQEIGLPYAADPAISRQLAGFLRAHGGITSKQAGGPGSPESDLARPNALLLNGGVFNSSKLADRLVQILATWWPNEPPIRLLENSSLDLAVARGAAFYGLVRHGLGQRITGGAAHSLYVGLEKANAETPLGLCVIPRGQEEGQTIDLGQRTFQLTLGRPVRFPLYSSTSDRVERAGDVVALDDEMSALPPIHTVLSSSKSSAAKVPVHLRSTLTEVGTLELWCVANAGSEQWRLEFELRGTNSSENISVTESVPARFADARILVEQVFGKGSLGHGSRATQSSSGKELKTLWANLERAIGPREDWPVALLRELWCVLFAGAARRRRSADHERIYFQLLGYTLRPGFGDALDEWRCEQTATLFPASVQFHKEQPVWTEFWILWRRIAGGLSEARQSEIWQTLSPHLAQRVPPHIPKHFAKPKGVQPEGLDEMVRLGAALEHLKPEEKTTLGDWIASRLQARGPLGGTWMWALGRLGTREPIYGSAHRVVSPEKAGEWLELLLAPNLVQTDGALFAASQLARLTGDRARDLDPNLRERVIASMRSAQVPASWLRMVQEKVVMDRADKARALGDTLPVGLQLV